MEKFGRLLGCIACLVSFGCEPIEPSGPISSTPSDVCETEFAVPSPYMGCTTIVGDFKVARITDDCFIDDVQYSCLSTIDEVYILGDYEVVDVVASVNGCSNCNGNAFTIK